MSRRAPARNGAVSTGGENFKKGGKSKGLRVWSSGREVDSTTRRAYPGAGTTSKRAEARKSTNIRDSLDRPGGKSPLGKKIGVLGENHEDCVNSFTGNL